MSRDYSPLCDEILPTDKHSTRDGEAIVRAIIHHWASTSMAGRDRLVYSDDPASANKLIYDNGKLIGSVPENRRAWTSGSAAADRPSITYELQNSTGAPGWKVSDEAIDTLTRALADDADYYGWGDLDGDNVGFDEVDGHREYSATACPGPYLWPRLDDIAKAAQRIRNGGTDDVPEKDPAKPKKRKPYYPGTLYYDGDKRSRGAAVVRWQKVLNYHGYGLAEDGSYGPKTESATKDWQGKRSLKKDGRVGPATWSRALTSDADARLRRGDRNDIVAVLQDIVREDRDAVFGPKTESGLQKVQRQIGVTDDGVAGPDTVNALRDYWT